MSTVKVSWSKNAYITTELNFEKIKFNDRQINIHHKEGVSAINLFLSSIIGCSTTTVLSLCKKRELSLEHLNTYIGTDEESSVDHPLSIERFRVKYIFEGVFKTDHEKLIWAVDSTHDKYCPMIYMAKRIAPVQYELHANGVLIHKSSNWQEELSVECDNVICDPYY